MIKLSRVLLIAILILSSCTEELLITDDGKTEYTIVIPQDAGKNDLQAARYLSDYIYQMSRARLEIHADSAAVADHEICIGNTNRMDLSHEGLAPDGYIIHSEGGKLYIAGGANKGSIYGVIDLLEEWGCRRFSPCEAWIPVHKRLALPAINRREEPLNELRIINGQMTKDGEFADWLRISTIQEMSAPGYYVHSFHRLLPKEEYFKTHPEYFAWLDTKHSADQLCPSNPEVKRLIIEKLKQEMDAHPGYQVWSVSQDDNFSYCRCDECRRVIEEEKSPAGPLIRLVNDIAAEFPDKVISTLAYQFSRPAPVLTRPAENVMVMLCTIELNRSRPIRNDSLSRSFVDDITDWGRICDNIYLWDYTINFNHSVSPFPNLHVLQDNLQFFYENSVRKQFPQSNLTSGLEFAEYRARIIASLLWDPYTDVDSVKNDFLARYYGDAAPYIRQYGDRMEEELIRSGKILYIYEPPNQHAGGYLSAGNVDHYNALFDQAEEAVADEPQLLKRVRVARLPLQYAIMEIGKNDMFGPRGWYEENDTAFSLRSDMLHTLESFHNVCMEKGIVTLNERSLSPEIYYASTRRFIDVQVSGNKAFRKPVYTNPPPAAKYAGGDPAVLTNGVKGAHDFNVHWLGWWGEDASLSLDLQENVSAKSIEIGSLWDGKSWILHPAAISCLVSADGKNYNSLGIQKVEGDQQAEERTRNYVFDASGHQYRFVRFDIEGFGKLPAWHPSEGEPAWFFVDEVIVR